MDLILLQPGNPGLVSNTSLATTGGSLISGNVTLAGADSLKCIELVSINQIIKQPTVSADGKPAPPTLTEFTCVKYLDSISVKLYNACLTAEPLGKGAQHPTMIYIAKNSGDATVNIMTFALRDAIVSEIELQSHPDDMPTEQFNLNFTEILWTYNVQKTGEAADDTITAGWSFIENQPITKFT